MCKIRLKCRAFQRLNGLAVFPKQLHQTLGECPRPIERALKGARGVLQPYRSALEVPRLFKQGTERSRSVLVGLPYPGAHAICSVRPENKMQLFTSHSGPGPGQSQSQPKQTL